MGRKWKRERRGRKWTRWGRGIEGRENGQGGEGGIKWEVGARKKGLEKVMKRVYIHLNFF